MDGGRTPTGLSRLLERQPELARIGAVLDDAAAGQARALQINGPAGIGKTALLEAARQAARERAMTVLSARGGELEANFPHGIVRQLFEPGVRRLPTVRRRTLLSGAAALAGPIVGGAADSAVDRASGHLHGLYWLTVNLAQQASLVLAVDDLHWADGPSIRFLSYLLRRLEGLPVALLLCTRTGEAASEPELTAQLASEPLLETIELRPLTEHAVAELIADQLSSAPDREFAAACTASTGGTPFLVCELLSAMADDGLSPSAEHAATVRQLGPPTVAHATLARLARMPEGCIPLARAIAVLSADATVARAARLAALGRSEALQALDALVEARLVRAGDPLSFEHPILRAAIYDELAPFERSRLHQDAARLLAEEGAEPDAVAAQLLASEPTGSAEVIEQLRQAAAGALRRGGPESAVTYLRRALQEGAGGAVRAAISFELATAARFATQPAVMLQHYRLAHELAADPVLRNTAALELALILVIIGGWDEPLALARDALAELGEGAPELTVRLECFCAVTAALDPRLVDQYDQRLPRLRELVKRDGGAAHALAVALAAVSACRGGDQDEVVALIERAWDDGSLVRARFDRWAPWYALLTLVLCEKLDRARELTETLLADARARGSLFGFLMGSAHGGLLESRSGQLAAAEGMLRTAIEGIREHNLFWELPWQLWFATDVMLERPEAADLAAIVEAVDLGPRMGVHSGAIVLDVRARVRHLAGRTPEAITDLRRAGEIYTTLKFRNPAVHGWRSALALMLPNEDREEALALARSELQDAESLAGARAIGVALRALGLLEGGADGRELLTRAVTVLEASPARLEHARALVELGASMRRAGERAAARDPLQAGMDIAASAGASRLTDYARSELAATGARPRRLRMTGVDALTPSELRIARLAAEGRTNKEVAQALFITPKTVDTHLGHIYMKLDIASRRNLAAALAGPALSP